MFSFSTNSAVWLNTLIAMVAFCSISSSIYLLNDCLDIESDRRHHSKRLRPIPSGKVTVRQAIITAIILAILSISVASKVSLGLIAIILCYAFIQIIYCLGLKNQPLLDLFCIASGFLLRAIAGGIAGEVPLSAWFLLTIGLLALFLAVEKRKAELQVSMKKGVATRKVLERYSLPLLLRLESLVSANAFMSYSLWAAGPGLNGASTSWMLLTVPFVLLGIFRYQLLSDPREAIRLGQMSSARTTEEPDEILLKDLGIQLILLGWIITTALIGIFYANS
jgi:4-hydroxybenzoate polyprenyltransferase